MNRKQLEEIWKLVKEIRALLREDTRGSYRLNSKLTDFEELLLDELREIVWQEYLKTLES